MAIIPPIGASVASAITPATTTSSTAPATSAGAADRRLELR